jgi:hypothetical protein
MKYSSHRTSEIYVYLTNLLITHIKLQQNDTIKSKVHALKKCDTFLRPRKVKILQERKFKFYKVNAGPSEEVKHGLKKGGCKENGISGREIF